jgi:D-beta-D-heptose 7-phosphate kinase / D-beta-D-heptose 1-phosphate adenosyltransferase
MPTRLIELVESLPKVRVALLGDLMIDRYIYGNAERLSPEAPVPVLHFQHEEQRLGGAGSVAADLAALGAAVQMIGFIGEDEMGRTVRRFLGEGGIDDSLLLDLKDRPTTCKVRLVGLAQHRHPQQMLRLDLEDQQPVPPEVAEQVLQRLEQALQAADILCIEDYNKGLLTHDLCQKAIAAAERAGVPVLIDPAAISDYRKYAGATAIKLNRTEMEKASRLPMENEADYARACEWMLQELDLEAVVVTLDKSGAYLATRAGQRSWLQTRPRAVYDVTGAGDMVVAMLAVARAAGASWADAVALANIAGGLEVERFGAIPITRPEIIQELLSEVHQRLGKQRTLQQLVHELQHHRDSGKRIVFTNGCFDLIHLGHVKYFQFAKQQGDLLVVAVNTDASIRRLKGPKRPIVNEQDRLSVLEELESIDYLLTFDEDTPISLIEQIRPDVLVKGADYAKEQVIGWELVESYGGRIALAPLIDGRSTSGVIQRILDAYGTAPRV